VQLWLLMALVLMLHQQWMVQAVQYMQMVLLFAELVMLLHAVIQQVVQVL
jgi:hypothetical protein